MILDTKHLPESAVNETKQAMELINAIEQQQDLSESKLHKVIESFARSHEKELQQISYLNHHIRHCKNGLVETLKELEIQVPSLDDYFNDQKSYEKDIFEIIFSHPKFSKVANNALFSWNPDSKPRDVISDAKTYLRLKQEYLAGIASTGFKPSSYEFGPVRHTLSHCLSVFGSYAYLFFSTPDDKKYERLKHVWYGEYRKLYSPAVIGALGSDYKGVYWSPAWAPTCGDFSKNGSWTLVDILKLKDHDKPDYFNHWFSKYRLVRCDIRKTPKFPKGIKPGSYDISFFNADWAGGGSTYRASDLALRKGGLVMTWRSRIADIHEQSPSKYSLFFDPQIESLQDDYVLLRKEE